MTKPETTFYESDAGGLQELSAARFEPVLLPGGWGIHERGSRLTAWCAVRYETRDAAEAFADLLNAHDEGQPRKVLDDLRQDLDRVRSVAMSVYTREPER